MLFHDTYSQSFSTQKFQMVLSDQTSSGVFAVSISNEIEFFAMSPDSPPISAQFTSVSSCQNIFISFENLI